MTDYRMSRNKFRWAMIGLAIPVLIVIVVWSLLALPLFHGLRSTTIENIISSRIGHPVQIDGSSRIKIGRNATLIMTDVVIKNENWIGEKRIASFKSLELNVPLCALLYCQATVNNAVVRGGAFFPEISENGQLKWVSAVKSAGEKNSHEATRIIARILSSITKASDISIKYSDHRTDYSIKAQIDEYELKRTQSNSWRSSGQGSLNGKPMTISGEYTEPLSSSTQSKNQPSLRIQSTGVELLAKSNLTSWVGPEGLDIGFEMNSSSIGDFLELIGIERALEGTGRLTTKLTGEITTLSANEIRIATDSENGGSININGAVADLWRMNGINLEFEKGFRKPENDEELTRELYDIELSSIDGKITGDRGRLQFDKLFIHTDAFDREFREIGPVNSGKLKITADGKLQLSGIHILAGPKNNPHIDIKGSINDLLRFGNVNFEGNLDLPVADVFGLQNVTSSKELGSFAGSFELKDEDGSLGIESLAISVTGTELVEGKIELVADDLIARKEIAFDADLSIPDYAAFAKVANTRAIEISSLHFDGKFKGSDEEATAAGSLVIGDTVIEGHLTVNKEGKRPKISGTIVSPVVDFDDIITAMSAISELRQQKKENNKTKDKSKRFRFAKLFDVDVFVTAHKIANSGSQSSKFLGKIDINRGKMVVQPLEVSYLGGEFDAQITADLNSENGTVIVKGKTRGWQLGSVLKEKYLGFPVSGNVSATYDLNGTGNSIPDILKSANGSVSFYSGQGRIGTTLLDLAGMGVFPWLFSDAKKNGYSKVRCIVAPFSVKNGRFYTSSLVLETEHVQVVAKGSIDIRNSAIKLHAQPRAIDSKFPSAATAFTITGSLKKPEIAIAAKTAGKKTKRVFKFGRKKKGKRKACQL